MSSSRLRHGAQAINSKFTDSPQNLFTEAPCRRRNHCLLGLCMRHFRFGVAVLAALVGLAVWVGETGASRAVERQSFLIASNDGYGLQDCLGEGGDCGRVVADAWCEAHGRGAALSFGPAEEVPGAVAGAAKPAKADRAYVVTCGD
jgi:hypothetical protein